MTQSDLRVWVLPGIYPYPDEPGERWKGIFSHRQALGLQRLGVDLHVVQPRDWYPPWPLWTIDRAWASARADWRPRTRTIDQVAVSHPVVFVPRPSRLFRTRHQERVVARLIRFFRSHGVRAGRDVILCHWLIPDGYIGTRVARALGLPIAVEILGDDIALWPAQSAVHLDQARWVLAHATTLVACSSDLGRQAVALSPSITQPHTIYMPVDADLFTPPTAAEKARLRVTLGLAADDLVVLSVGTAVKRKGWLELLDAIRVLATEFPKLKLLAAHGGVPDLDLAQEAGQRGVLDRLISVGEVAPDGMPALYRAADMFVLASHREGLANVVLEAMATGLPVVTTPVGGHPEVLNPGVNGEFVPVSDAAALVSTLRALLSNPHVWPDYGRKARAAVERIASPSLTAQRMMTVLESIRNVQTPLNQP